MDDFENLLQQYNYEIKPDLIAKHPASPRDAARLLVFNRDSKEIAEDTFRNLAHYLPKNAVVVFNQTRVIPARLTAHKPSGGKCRILFLEQSGKNISALIDRQVKTGNRLNITPNISFTVLNKTGSKYTLKPSFRINQLEKILFTHGHTPLPPYIKNPEIGERSLRKKYQTVFAKKGRSAAAPTASLHFTDRLLNDLKKRGMSIQFVQLEVGLGTFASLNEENIRTKKLHHEKYSISSKTAAFLNKAKLAGRPIVAVGTTVVRTLESATSLFPPLPLGEGRVRVRDHYKLTNLSGSTNLFIQPGYKFRFVDGLITNFHVPKSSLLMLVSAFTGREQTLMLYKFALKKNYRFFSFGDGMLLL